MIDCGEGNEITLTIGGKTSVPSIAQVGHGISCTGKVRKITDGRFTIKGPMQTGLEVSLGRTAVLEIGAAQILLSEERWEPYDPGCFTHAGLDPESCRFILVKSRQHFRAGFESIASHIVLAAGPGVCSSDYAQFDFKRLLRPIFPLDMDMTLDNQRLVT
jgi:microcystin degradation protein MlrC